MKNSTKNIEKKSKNYIGILLIMSTAYIAVGINVQGFKAMLPLVTRDFQISGAQAGFYATAFFLSGTLLAITSGRVVDRIGPKKALVGATMIISSLMFLHTLMPVFSLILFLAFLTGIGFSIITPAINKGIISMVPPEKRAVSIGIAQAGGGVGGILGASLLPFLGDNLGWRSALLLAAIVALMMALILVKFYNPTLISEKNKQDTKNIPSSFKEDFVDLMKNPVLIYVCFMGLVFGFSIGNMTIHYTLFLTRDIGLTPAFAGFSLSSFMFGGIIGQPSMGYLNDRFLKSNRRLGLFILGGISSMIFLIIGILMFLWSLSFYMILGISFILGMFALAIPGLVFTTIGDVVEDRLVGTATGITLVFIRTGVVIGPPTIGFIADIRGDYQASWILLALSIFLISIVFLVGTRKHKNRLFGGRKVIS